MAESTLSIDYDEIRAEMGRRMGRGRDSSNWGSGDTATMAACLKKAQRQAYFPPNGHQWNFLRPMATMELWSSITGTINTATYSASTGLTTIVATASVFKPTCPGHSLVDDSTDNSYTIDSYTSGTTVLVVGNASAETGTFAVTGDDVYRAPDNFANIEDGKMWFSADNAYQRRTVDQVSPGIIEQARSNDITGIPARFAVVPTLNLAGQQRWDFIFYPQPDGVYTLRYRYRVQPDVLTSTATAPYGPTWFGEILLASARAEIEREIFGQYGADRQTFLSLLDAGMVNDRKTDAQVLGPMLSPNQQFRFGVELGEDIITY